MTPASKWIPQIKKNMKKKFDLMGFSIKGVLVISVILMFPSCLTVGMIERNCDKFAKVCVESETSDTVFIYRSDTTYIKRDSLVYVTLPADTVEKKIPVYIKDGIINSDTLYASAEFGEAWAWVFNSDLNLKLFQFENSYEFEIEIRDKVIENLNKQIITLEKNIIVKEKWWEKVGRQWYLYAIIIILVLVLIDTRFYKFKQDETKIN